jgi:hypothetical protein
VEIVSQLHRLAGLVFELKIKRHLLIEPLIDADIRQVRRR